ncbi:MAG: TetR/AcrR family transcriptional regulator [Pseudomonadota bacterium]|jgi:TetR/AcrR family hemagglutinin/protease transcriptional regulator
MERAARFESLLEAAIEAMAERGVARAAHADVASRSGVSVPTVFFYFRTRPLLVEAVLAEIDRFLFSVIDEGCREGGSAREMIRRILRIFVSHVETEPARIRVWLDWSTAVREDIWNKYVALQARIIARFRELIATGQAADDIARTVDSDDAAHLLVGQGHMLVLMRLAGVDAQRVSHFIDHLVDSTVPPGPPSSMVDAPM